MKFYIGLVAILISNFAFAQSKSKRVLFIGNSYTYYNNMPNLVNSLANSVGDTVIHDSHAPGGETFQGHASNSTTLSKIQQGNWDFVVLQEQSQRPAFPIFQVGNSVFPYAKDLVNKIRQSNPCTEPVFYMTWGRKNGDPTNCQYYAPLCTYEGMDDLLRERYEMMADSNSALLSPVGAVWRYLRTNHTSIELYDADESHPSLAGSYAAAVTFYTVIFRKDPSLLTFNSTLNSTDAQIIRNAVKTIVYNDLLNWNIGKFDPKAQFTSTQTDVSTYTFQNLSQEATNYHWDFGDWITSTEENPTHYFQAIGNFTVTLNAKKCNYSDVYTQTINITQVGLENEHINTINVYPNPSSDFINIQNVNSPFSIVDINGKTVLNGVLNPENSSINLKDLEPGLYFINILNSNQVFKIVRK